MDDFFTFAATRTDELDDTDEFSAVRFHVTAQLAGRTFEQFRRAHQWTMGPRTPGMGCAGRVTALTYTGR